jgi:hypothetical protein
MVRILLLIIIISGGILLINAVHKSHESDIRKWAAEKSYDITSIDIQSFNYGPYYYSDGCNIYKVKITTRDSIAKTFYFRFGITTDIEEYNK